MVSCDCISNLLTGASVNITDSSDLSRVEMIFFTKDNQLVVRVTQMGFCAFAPDGSVTLGSANELGIFIRNRDMLGFDLYDKDHLPLRIDAKLFFASNGIFVAGEDGRANRILSVDDIWTHMRDKWLTFFMICLSGQYAHG